MRVSLFATKKAEVRRQASLSIPTCSSAIRLQHSYRASILTGEVVVVVRGGGVIIGKKGSFNIQIMFLQFFFRRVRKITKSDC